jgi:CBS domain-containing protein
MAEINHRLQPEQVPSGVNLVSPERDPSKRISEDSPAMSVMTDLRIITPFQIENSASLEAVNEKMIACGVRLLFVSDKQGLLKGLVTSNDILGEKPMFFVTNNCCSRDDI